MLIKARNEHVKEGLQKAYAAKAPGEKLDVFCISNTTYEKYAEKGNAQLVDASGIPQLRKFCQSITAEAQFREALHFLRSTLPNLLNSVELWVSAHMAVQARRKTVLDVGIYRILADITNEVSRYPQLDSGTGR